MKIKGKSLKGKNRIKEGLGTEVVVLMHSPKGVPPAVLVAPINDPTLSSKFVRWIALQDDRDFIIEEM